MSDFIKRIESGTAQVLNTGTVTSYGDEPVSFVFEQDWKINLVFRIDEEDKSTRMTSESVAENNLSIILINFKSTIGGTGTVAPVSVGEYKGKKLAMNFHVFNYAGTKQKTIHYTFYAYE